MAHPTAELIEGLREAARRLKSGAEYSWGNHGSCNCGHLLQSLTQKPAPAILREAHTGVGEWTELAEEYCSVTEIPVSALVGVLMQAGLTVTDIHHLEYLDDKEVLQQLPDGFRWLKRNKREDVILYFEAYANLLEGQLTAATPVDFQLFFARPGKKDKMKKGSPKPTDAILFEI